MQCNCLKSIIYGIIKYYYHSIFLQIFEDIALKCPNFVRIVLVFKNGDKYLLNAKLGKILTHFFWIHFYLISNKVYCIDIDPIYYPYKIPKSDIRILESLCNEYNAELRYTGGYGFHIYTSDLSILRMLKKELSGYHFDVRRKYIPLYVLNYKTGIPSQEVQKELLTILDIQPALNNMRFTIKTLKDIRSKLPIQLDFKSNCIYKVNAQELIYIYLRYNNAFKIIGIEH